MTAVLSASRRSVFAYDGRTYFIDPDSGHVWRHAKGRNIRPVLVVDDQGAALKAVDLDLVGSNCVIGIDAQDVVWIIGPDNVAARREA